MNDPIPPWEIEQTFPEKPAGSEYGYVYIRKKVGCTREELIKKCSIGNGFSPIQLVWCPEFPRLTPVANVDFLADALLARIQSQVTANLQMGWFSLIIYTISALLMPGFMMRLWILSLAIGTGLLPLINGYYERRQLQGDRAKLFARQLTMERYETWVLSRRIFFTWVLLGMVGIIFAVQFLDFPRATYKAGLVKPLVWQGEWWRLFTGPLLHGSLIHFIFNVTALFGLGRLMEVLASRYHLALVFAVSALSGSLFSLFLMPHSNSVGISGGLLGLIGFLTVLGLKRKEFLPPRFVKLMILNIAIIAVMGIISFSVVDNAAHCGGLVAGIVLGLVLIDSQQRGLPLVTGKKLRLAGMAALVMTLGFGVFTLFRLRSH